MAVVVSFLSDFGYKDEFVGVVHGVIASLAPEAKVIDVGHGTPRGDVRSAALALTRAIQYLPEGVCLAVVDPGVGTDRKAIAAETAWGFLVGPDNGLLSPATAMVGGASRIVSIEEQKAKIPSPGETFHGRDVFAPAAALLAGGGSLSDLGPTMAPEDVTPLILPLAEADGVAVKGEAWWVDRFGNVQTNITPDDLAGLGLAPGMSASVTIRGETLDVKWVTSYAGAAVGETLMHIDSAGMMALAVRGGDAAAVHNLTDGAAITVGSSLK